MIKQFLKNNMINKKDLYGMCNYQKTQKTVQQALLLLSEVTATTFGR
jgi:hypothetical protein